MGTSAAAQAQQGWQGRLRLDFGVRRGRTVLVHREHRGPLLVQSPFHPEGDVCHVYLLHPPGGVVGGDSLALEARLASGSHALLTTPAATKLYRSGGPQARVSQCLSVEDGATAEWLPQESLAFDGARARLSTRVELHGAARFLGWEALCLGRPAAGERFRQGALRQELELWHEERPVLIERNALEPDGALLQGRFGLDGHCALATLLAVPAEEHLLRAARRVTTAFGAGLAAATCVDGVLACRVLGSDMLRIRALMRALWCALRPLLLARDAVAPRIWAT